jgi:RNA-directed DNA polymerase
MRSRTESSGARESRKHSTLRVDARWASSLLTPILGFTHCCSSTRKGWFAILRLTIKKRMRATLKAIRAKLREKMHDPVPEVGKWLGSVVRGYFNYFGVPRNSYRLRSFRSEVCRAWLRMLKRRSQKHHLSWARFKKLINRYIPQNHNTHPYPEQRFRVTT